MRTAGRATGGAGEERAFRNTPTPFVCASTIRLGPDEIKSSRYSHFSKASAATLSSSFSFVSPPGPGVMYTGVITTRYFRDFGSQLESGILSY